MAAPVNGRGARTVLKTLINAYPDARCELDFTTPLELLVATVLSAQSTDRRVNTVTPRLFEQCPDAASYAACPPMVLEEIIRPTGLFRTKAANLCRIGQVLTERFSGEVPVTMNELLTLPGVGRKTATVVLGEAFGVPGISVDTHVARVSQRLHWTESTDPVVIERELAQLFPAQDWVRLSHVVIWHGRRCCHARKPACGACPIADQCPSFGAGPTDPLIAAGLVTELGPR